MLGQFSDISSHWMKLKKTSVWQNKNKKIEELKQRRNMAGYICPKNDTLQMTSFLQTVN